MLIATFGSAQAQVAQDADKGRAEFLANCAGCHGTDGKGAGQLSTKLNIKPADLTTLATRNNGVFEPNVVYQMIDGRGTDINHRSIDMPIWGCRHSSTPSMSRTIRNRKNKKLTASPQKLHETPLSSLLDLPCDPEATIENRILSIVGYLRRIQER